MLFTEIILSRHNLLRAGLCSGWRVINPPLHLSFLPVTFGFAQEEKIRPLTLGFPPGAVN